MLLSLPLELQLDVLAALRLPRLPTGTKPCLNTEFVSRRGALYNLCLTSRCLYEKAAPLLHENIALTNDISIAQLFRTLLANRSRRAWIHSIACPLDLMQETDVHNGLPIWNEFVATKGDTPLDIQEELALNMVGLTIDHIGEDDHRAEEEGPDFYDRVFGAILCLTTSLQDILLQLPQTNERLGGLDNVHAALEQAIDAHDTGVLPALRSVRIQAPPSKTPADGYLSPEQVPWWRLASGIDPMRLPTFEVEGVRDVEFRGDDGLWFCLLRPALGPWTDEMLPNDLESFRSLPSLKLYESRTSPEYLACLLKEAHGLETFHYTTRRQEWRRDFYLPDLDGFYFVPAHKATINEALWPIRKTIKELRLGSVRRERDAGDEEYSGLETIHVLGSFDKLTRLIVDIRWILPFPNSFLDSDMGKVSSGMPALRDRLPASLQELELVETWTSTERSFFHSDELEGKGNVFSQYALLSLLPSPGGQRNARGAPRLLASLRRVTLRAEKSTHRNSTPSADDSFVSSLNAHNLGRVGLKAASLRTKEGIDAMTELFRQQSIEFKVEWIISNA